MFGHGSEKREQMTKALGNARDIISVGAVLSVVAIAIALYAVHVARKVTPA